MDTLDPHSVPSPCYVVDECTVERNLQVLDRVQQATGVKILLALKGFAMWRLAPLVNQYLSGVCASGLHETLLGAEHYRGEIHVFSPSFAASELEQVMPLASHISFNSLTQWQRFKSMFEHASQLGSAAPGLRINPQHSEVQTAIYDPCAPGSHLGTTQAQIDAALGEMPDAMAGIEGLHFHTLCELNADALERTLAVVEQRFGSRLADMQWVNMGGGHHITRPDYDVDQLIHLLNGFQQRYPKPQVYLEPGEAIALNTGVLVATVVDVFRNDLDIAILDVSATAHMPDILEMPYRPEIIGHRPDSLPGSLPGEWAHTYRLGGPTCLAGDVIGDYSFDRPLQVGDKLIFDDMAHYTMVKTTTFNGVPLPSIAVHNSSSGETHVVKQFGYEDYRDRLS